MPVTSRTVRAVRVEAELFVPGPRTARSLCVLSSSSGGNCSALIHGEGALRRVTLIDAGLSPRRTGKLLAELGLGVEHIDDVIFTHLDSDHCYAGWAKFLPAHARFRIHKRHRSRAERMGILVRRTEIFDQPFHMPSGARVTPLLASHDDLGTATFRFDFEDGCGSLGWATDLGRVPAGVVELFRGVHILAIESNYCPKMQRASGRSKALQDRIMDGSGHLSNEQCADAVRDISPRRHVVLLHLSRQCNTPGIAAAHHAGAPYGLTISRHDGASELVPLH